MFDEVKFCGDGEVGAANSGVRNNVLLQTESIMMLRAARSLAGTALRARGLKAGSAARSASLLPPLKVAVTGAAGQIGYALVMRIARYVDRESS